ncbi:MAG: hypothetical protein II147_02550 [Lachnospiraceae bacterium]|nr:hypothetical protein [Lachnospiraceae bacterium]
MEELYNKLIAVPDSYFAFVMGILAYAKKKPAKIPVIINFINENENITSSDIIEFISLQPDFHEACVASSETITQ